MLRLGLLRARRFRRMECLTLLRPKDLRFLRPYLLLLRVGWLIFLRMVNLRLARLIGLGLRMELLRLFRAVQILGVRLGWRLRVEILPRNRGHMLASAWWRRWRVKAWIIAGKFRAGWRDGAHVPGVAVLNRLMR